MGKLTGQTIADSYDQLVIVDDADGINSSLQPLESADTGGGVSALQIATNLVKVKPSASDEAKAFSVNKADDTGIVSVNSVTEQVNVDAHDASSKGLALGGTLITASAAELNIMDGVVATYDELNVIDGDAGTGTGTLAANSRILTEIGGTTQKKEVSELETHLQDHFARPMTIPLWNASSSYAMSNTSGQDLSNCESLFNFADLGAGTFNLKLYVHITSSSSSAFNFQLQYDDAGSNGNIAITHTGGTSTTINGTTLYESANSGDITFGGLVKFNLHGWVADNTTSFNKAWFWIQPNS